MDWDSYESVDVRGAISKVGHILNGRDLDGKKRPLGPVNMRPLRYLMLLYLAKMSPKYKDMGKAVNNHLYFSTPHLDKVASDMNPQLEFDRKRCLEVYEKYSKAGLVDIVEENHVTRVGITEAGETKCLENLEDLMSNEYPSEKDHFFRPKVVALKTPVTTNEARYDN
ncbi:hypothetical protein [Candidatus Nitrosocosmicus sp. FF01]|uniref:hypothetical protein n=1 Tax=Candidatus Nitrosocosmicus sp. FF01 TaxID=3397670 RepID=UPI0039EC9FE0